MALDPARRRRWPLWLALGVASLLVSHSLLFTVYQVEGSSMEPTLRGGQRVWGLKHFNEIQRGDVVLFRHPSTQGKDMLKRVEGLPGETVRLAEGRVFINGVALEEPYVAPNHGLDPALDLEWTLGDYDYFVLGDNRSDSLDSRRLGPVKRQWITGMV